MEGLLAYAGDPRRKEPRSWELEWSEQMRYLERLDAAYREGHLTVDQRSRYTKLLRLLRAALPVIDELEIERPTVPLEA